jgi:amino-acid N-acetyltransferase
MNITVTPAIDADISAILELLQRCELPIAGVAENVRAFAVARLDGVVVGVSGVEIYGSRGLLRSVAVERSARDRGIAALLVAHVVAHAERAGLSALYLLTTTARTYFEGHGFTLCPRDEAPEGIRDSWEFRTGCPDSAAFMRRVLGSGQPTTHVVEILYFAGCPHVEDAKRTVAAGIAQAGAAERAQVRVVEIADEIAARQRRFLGSPTVRVDGRDVEESSLTRDDFGLQCRVYDAEGGRRGSPPAEWVAAALRRPRSSR